MKQFLILLSLALARLSNMAQQPTFQEGAYRLDSKYKFMCTSDVDRQGNVIMAGLIRPSAADMHNSMLLLLKPDTDTLWTRRGADAVDYATYPGVKFRTNGGYAFATTFQKSYVQPFPADNYDGVLQKFSPAGSLLMNKVIDPASDGNSITGFLTLPDKGYLISGGGGIAGFPWAFSLTRTDSAGNVLWQRNLTNVSPDGLDYMQHAGNGRYILAGGIPTGAAGTQPYKIKLYLVDANGDSLRANTYNLTGDPTRTEAMYNGSEQCLVSLSDGGFLFTGFADTANAATGIYGTVGVIAKVNANLQVVWRHFYRTGVGASTVNYSYRRAIELKDGTILVLGQQYLGSNPINNFELFRFSATGKVMATYPFSSSLYPSARPNTLEALPDSSFMIGGMCRTASNAQTGFYIAKVKIPGLPAGRPTYIMATEDELVTASASLGAAYPNPAREQVYIPYSLPVGKHAAKVVLRDITGREVSSYNVKQKHGNLPVNVSRLPHGLYLYTLEVDGKPIATKKLAVMK